MLNRHGAVQHVIDEVVKQLVDGTLTGVVYDTQPALSRASSHSIPRIRYFASLINGRWRMQPFSCHRLRIRKFALRELLLIITC